MKITKRQLKKIIKEEITRFHEGESGWSPEERAKVEEAGRWYYDENRKELLQGGNPSALRDLEEVAFGGSDPAETGWSEDEAEAILETVNGLLFQESGGDLGEEWRNSMFELP